MVACWVPGPSFSTSLYSLTVTTRTTTEAVNFTSCCHHSKKGKKSSGSLRLAGATRPTCSAAATCETCVFFCGCWPCVWGCDCGGCEACCTCWLRACAMAFGSSVSQLFCLLAAGRGSGAPPTASALGGALLGDIAGCVAPAAAAAAPGLGCIGCDGDVVAGICGRGG